MLAQRVLTAVVLLAAFMAALWWLPQSAWGVLLAVCAMLAAAEWGRLSGLRIVARRLYVAATGAVCLGMLGALLASRVQDAWWRDAPFVLNASFWLLVAAPVLLRPSLKVTAAQAALCGAIVIVPTYWAFVLLQPQAGAFLTLLGVIWVADTAAYLCGRRWGRHKLAPQVSPGKTWEGVAGAMAAVAVYAWAMQFLMAKNFPALAGFRWFALAFALVAFGIVGDLFESWLKRRANVKDSGRLLPGHGGVLDRIDALTAAMPLAALAVNWPA
jgi:phosphatidate cytidylyltransferase